MTDDGAGTDWDKSCCMIYWEYLVPENSERFESYYGPGGRRETLYRGAEGFVRSELQRDASDATIYRTADYWESREAFLAFLRNHSADYDAMSQECEELSAKQTNLGVFLVPAIGD